MIVEALSNIDHDGESYQAGDKFAVSEEQGNTLINDKVAIFSSWNKDEVREDRPALDLWHMPRPELNDYAVTLGIDPTKFAGRLALIDAIQHVLKGAIKTEKPEAKAEKPKEAKKEVKKAKAEKVEETPEEESTEIPEQEAVETETPEAPQEPMVDAPVDEPTQEVEEPKEDISEPVEEAPQAPVEG